MENLGRGT
jgi:hypothetical protein